MADVVREAPGQPGDSATLSPASPTRLDRYLARTTTPMLVAAFAYLVVYTAQVVWIGANGAQSRILEGLALALYLVFLIDFALRIYMSEDRLRYIMRNPIDLVVIVLPAARSLRVLRVFAALRVLVERGQRVNAGTAWLSLMVAVSLLVYVAALAVLDAERGAPDATITSFPDALWWGFVTVTTVGYGDEFPVTATGQITAVFLMLVGIGLLGSVTATVASWIADRFQQQEDIEQLAILEELRAIREELAVLRAAAGVPGDDSVATPDGGATATTTPATTTTTSDSN